MDEVFDLMLAELRRLRSAFGGFLSPEDQASLSRLIMEAGAMQTERDAQSFNRQQPSRDVYDDGAVWGSSG